MFPFRPPTQSTQTGNPILDTFFSTILPMIQERSRINQINQNRALTEQRRFEAGEKEKDRALQLNLANIRETPNITPPVNPAAIRQPEPNVRVGNFGITPYQEAQIELRGRQLTQAEELARDKLLLDTQKAEEAERKNKAAEQTNVRKVEETERSNKAREETARKMAEIAQIRVDKTMPERERLELTNKLQKERALLQGDLTIEQINLRSLYDRKLAELRGDIQSDLQRERAGYESVHIEEREEAGKRRDLARILSTPETPAATKQRLMNNHQLLRIRRPDLAELVELDDEGMMNISEDATEEQAAEIRKLLLSGQRPEPVTNVNTEGLTPKPKTDPLGLRK